MSRRVTPDYAYENTRRVCYGEDRATFIPVCDQCARFVKRPKSVTFDTNGFPDPPNQAHCSRCGPTMMVFEGYV